MSTRDVTVLHYDRWPLTVAGVTIPRRTGDTPARVKVSAEQAAALREHPAVAGLVASGRIELR